MFLRSEEPPSSCWHRFGQTFRSLGNRGYRIYTGGQVVSMTGSAMQDMALSWLAYRMTHSAAVLGLVVLCTKLPLLLLSLFGGKLADGYDRRRVIVATQWVEMAQAAILTVLVLNGGLQVWMLLALSVVLGTSMAFELPARAALVSELVGGKNIVNAVSLNTVVFNVTRMIGPAIGAILLVHCGPTLCFALNAVSFAAAIVSLWCIRKEVQVPSARPAGSSTIAEGLKYAANNTTIRKTLLLSLVLSFFGCQINTLMPMVAEDIFPNAPHALGWLISASSLGALFTGLLVAGIREDRALLRYIKLAASVFPVTLLLFSLSRVLHLSLVIQVAVGASITVQLICCNALVLLATPQFLRGRLNALLNMASLGAMPFGSLVIGWFADRFGAPLALVVCASACAASAVYFILIPDGDNVEGEVAAPVPAVPVVIALRVKIDDGQPDLENLRNQRAAGDPVHV